MRLNFEFNLLLPSPAHHATLTRIRGDDFYFTRCGEIERADFARRALHRPLREAVLRPLSPMF